MVVLSFSSVRQCAICDLIFFFLAVVKNNANMTVVQNRLEIKHVQTHHHGLYTCIATDGDGNTKSQNISLKINKNCGRKNDSSLIVIYLLVHVYSFCFIGL